MALPGAVTLSFLPQTPFAGELARTAHAAGKEIMLHLPMEAVSGKRLGAGGLTLDMTREAFVRTVRNGLAALPFARGVNNHMGSLLTRHPGHMAWLMEVLREEAFYFVDSRTTPKTVAEPMAAEYRVPHRRRDVFLDTTRDPAQIRNQFARLLTLARQQGSALAIGHPYPETLAFLEQRLPQLAAEGVLLVPASELTEPEPQRRPRLWHASLSPSPRAAKNSKP